MRISLRFFCLLLAITMGTGCTSVPSPKRPEIYRGGQYYGDARHAADLQNQ